MPALSASRHDPNVRDYYRHLIETRGLKKIQTVCAAMRKLLQAIHAMLKNRTPYRQLLPPYFPPMRWPINPIYGAAVNFCEWGGILVLHRNRASTGYQLKLVG